MKVFGTDVLALACIAGCAVVGVAVTAAVLDGGDVEGRGDASCAVEVSDQARSYSISHDGNRIVVAPGVMVSGVVLGDGSVCTAAHLARVRIDMQRTRDHTHRVERIRIRGLEEALESQGEAIEEAAEAYEEAMEFEIQARLEAEMQRLEETMERLGRDTGR